MRDKDNVSEALVLRIVKNAERNAIDTLQTQKGWGSGSAGLGGRPTHTQYPPV